MIKELTKQIAIGSSILVLVVAPSLANAQTINLAILSNQKSSSQTATTNNLLKQILNELQQIHQLQQDPGLPTPSTILSSPPPFNATTCKPVLRL
jgi:hypothetical protein